jgi:hypothetical protein
VTDILGRSLPIEWQDLVNPHTRLCCCGGAGSSNFASRRRIEDRSHEGVPAGVLADLLEPRVRAASITLADCASTTAGRVEICDQPVDVLGVPVKDYLTAVMPGLNRRTLSQVANLTPARWSTRRA